MKTIPTDERDLSDIDFFAAFDLSQPQLKPVADCLAQHNLPMAKAALVHYFEIRKTPAYFFDSRSLPLAKINTEEQPSFFFTSAGAGRNLKDFCIYAGQKLMEHIYVRHGNEGIEINLGPNYENLPHFNYYKDQGKKHRTILDIFVRGHIFEYLAILYHETGDKKVLKQFEETLQIFFKNYPLVLENTAADASHFSFTEERDVMSAGYLALLYLSLFYTRVPYEISTELAFELLKRVWFLGIQFRRFDIDTYEKHNHHMWERGLVPYMLAILLPEMPDLVTVKEHAADIICHHVRDDFNEQGGYSEHSIAYWSGAALGGMLCRGIYLAKLNGEALLDDDAKSRIESSYHVLALISPPGSAYAAIGDNGGTGVEPTLYTGSTICGSPTCQEVLALRSGKQASSASIPLDYCDDRCGFACSRSSFCRDANYMLMSVKTSCGDSGHNHMDMLSLSISIRGQEFIGEPHSRQMYHTIRMGSEQRGYMYNMESHNTVLVHGQPVLPNRVYANKWGVYRPDSPVESFITGERGSRISAFHDAYTFCRHERNVLFCREKGMLIQDHIIGGSRLPEAHIQRWHLMADVKYTQIDTHSVLLSKNEVQVLMLWSKTPALQFHKPENLYPDIVKNKEDLATIIDASFYAKNQGNDISNTADQSVLFLDVTGRGLSSSQQERLLEAMSAMDLCDDMEHALDIFSAL